MKTQAGKRSQSETADGIQAVAEKANSGDGEPLTELRRFLGTAEWDRLVNQFGDMAEMADSTLLSKCYGDHKLLSECVRSKLESLRLELSGPSPTPLERLLVERVVACWLHVYYTDYQVALNLEQSLALCEQLARLQDRTQMRYLAAIKTLAVVRRLALPITLDVSVAGSVTTKTAERMSTPRRLLPIGSEN